MPTREELEHEFNRAGIDFANPGFYDSPAFHDAERRNPPLIVEYARCIKTLVFSAEYIDRARAAPSAQRR
jgi:hypothetical protein